MTIFTEIIEGTRSGFIIFEDENHVAILDKYPIDTGHSLVIPKKPYEKIIDMPKSEVAELFSLVPEIANAILKATGAVAFSIAQNNGKEAKQIIDAQNKYVLPGGVDGHCHLDQRTKDGTEMSDNFESGTRSAAFGGTTTVMPFAIQFKGESLREVIDEYHTRAKNQSYIDYTFHPIISDASPNIINQELPAIVRDGYTHFKIYMT